MDLPLCQGVRPLQQGVAQACARVDGVAAGTQGADRLPDGGPGDAQPAADLLSGEIRAGMVSEEFIDLFLADGEPLLSAVLKIAC